MLRSHPSELLLPCVVLIISPYTPVPGTHTQTRVCVPFQESRIRQEVVNREIKLNLTQILLEVTDALFGERGCASA